MQQLLESAMNAYASGSRLLGTADGCAAASAPNTHAKRAHVLGRTGPFVQVDGFLHELAAQHNRACASRSERVSALVGSHLNNSPGEAISLSQFATLVDSFRPGLPAETIEELHASCMALGGGALDASDLEQALFRVGQLQRTEQVSGGKRPHHDMAAAESELAEIAGKWHTMLTAEPSDAANEVAPQSVESPLRSPFRIPLDPPKQGRFAQQPPTHGQQQHAHAVLLGIQGNQQLPPQQLSAGKAKKPRRASMPATGHRWVG